MEQKYTKEEVDIIKSQLTSQILRLEEKLCELRKSQLRDMQDQWVYIVEMEKQMRN